MLTITNTNNLCETITATMDVPGFQYFQEITGDGGDNSQHCCYVLEVSSNCCKPLEYTLPVNYQFSALNEGACGTQTINGDPYLYFEYTISGVDLDCIEDIKMTNTVSGVVYAYNSVTKVFRLASFEVSSFSVTLEVTICGNVYTFTFTVNIAGECDASTSVPSVVYPDLPEGIDLSQSNLDIMTLYPEIFGLTGTCFPDGIYRVSMSRDGVAFSDCIFLNCNTFCLVVDKLVQDPESNIHSLYDALIYADSCETITCQQKCDLWEFIYKELNLHRPVDVDKAGCGCS